MFLLPGKQLIEKIAKQKGVSVEEQMLNMATKGLLKEKHVLSVENVKKKYQKIILDEMNKALFH